VLRTLAGPLAGANLMPWRKFIFANAVSSGLWAASYGYAAYWLGGEFERLQGRMVVPLIFIAAVALVGGGLFVWRRETQLIRARDTWATRIESKALTLECVTVTSVGYSPHQYSAPPHTSAPGLSEQCCASQQNRMLNVRFTPESGHSWA
jgi:hypothetical protein